MRIAKMIASGVLGGGGISFPLTIDFSTIGSIPSSVKSDGSFGVSGGMAVLTSPYTGEKLTDTGFEDWTNPTTLNIANYAVTLFNGDSVHQEVDCHGGINAARWDGGATLNHGDIIYKNITLTSAKWARSEIWAKRSATNPLSIYLSGVSQSVFALTETYAKYISTQFRATNMTRASINIAGSPNANGYYDDFSVTELPLSKSIAYIDKEIDSPWVKMRGVVPAGAWAGVIINLDNPANPQNYILGLYNGSNYSVLYKCVNGTITALIPSGVVSNLPGSRVIMELGWSSPTTVDLHVNGKLVVGSQTVEDASILSGKYCGFVESDGTDGVVKFCAYPELLGSVMTIGNSITANPDEIYGMGWTEALTDQIGAYTTYPYRIADTNYKVSDTKAYIDAKLAAAVGTPTLVVISHGANDIPGLPDEALYKTNVAYILDAIHAKYPAAHVWWHTEFRNGADAQSNTLHGWNETVINDGRTSWAHLGINAVSVFSGHLELLSDNVHPNYAGAVAYAAAMKVAMGL